MKYDGIFADHLWQVSPRTGEVSSRTTWMLR